MCIETGEEYRVKLANVYLDSLDAESSLFVISPLLEGNKGSFASYLVAAKASMELGNSSQAETLLKKAQAIDSSSGEVYNLLGIINVEKGNFEQAREMFEMARSRFYDDVKVKNNLALLDVFEGKQKQALSRLSSLTEEQRSDEQIKSNLLVIMAKNGQREFVLDALDSSLSEIHKNKIYLALRDSESFVPHHRTQQDLPQDTLIEPTSLQTEPKLFDTELVQAEQTTNSTIADSLVKQDVEPAEEATDNLETDELVALSTEVNRQNVEQSSDSNASDATTSEVPDSDLMVSNSESDESLLVITVKESGVAQSQNKIAHSLEEGEEQLELAAEVSDDAAITVGQEPDQVGGQATLVEEMQLEQNEVETQDAPLQTDVQADRLSDELAQQATPVDPISPANDVLTVDDSQTSDNELDLDVQAEVSPESSGEA
ncbi:tetratricopeptide repeat protein [Vibrio panuliri]|uniref:Tetratricopeptide repeat protein n=1 Tax=Vibrio panuliri TaxID=1381081 RepID=A0ABX3FAH3_9VIBR|nr:hypothetical protein [Vibrio panuliri]OLQ87677.1 hypothetical protein BIY20_13275 [Vibrio panuliri]